jgi:hypothetical protein
MCYFWKEIPKSRRIYAVTTYNSGSPPERATEKLEGMVITEGGQLKLKSDPLTVYVQALSYLIMCHVTARLLPSRLSKV